ncbi:MAG: YopX family protein [Sarcina sp.]
MKYRLWDKKAKCMETFYQLAVNPSGQIYMDGINVTGRYEQSVWTGLYDENGDEIYVGDIVEFDNKRYKIVQERGAFALCTLDYSYEIDYDMLDVFKQNIKGTEDTWWDGTRNDYIVPLCDFFDNFEYHDEFIMCFKVMGNIYANKELLEPIK